MCVSAAAWPLFCISLDVSIAYFCQLHKTILTIGIKNGHHAQSQEKKRKYSIDAAFDVVLDVVLVELYVSSMLSAYMVIISLSLIIYKFAINISCFAHSNCVISAILALQHSCLLCRRVEFI